MKSNLTRKKFSKQVQKRCKINKNKIAFQQDAYRPLIARISQHALCMGVSGPWGVCSGGVGIPACTEADQSPVNRMTDRCKNITLPQTLFAGGKKSPWIKVGSKDVLSPKSEI